MSRFTFRKSHPFNYGPERLWDRLIKTETCWLFHDDRNRYGSLGYKGQTWGAHRLAYALTYGDIPRGMLVCHKCDTPACCRPDHLFLGTRADNAMDMIAKGRANFQQPGWTMPEGMGPKKIA